MLSLTIGHGSGPGRSMETVLEKDAELHGVLGRGPEVIRVHKTIRLVVSTGTKM